MKRVAYISAALVVAMMLASGCSSDILGPDTGTSDLVADPADFSQVTSAKGTDPIGDGPVPMLPYPKELWDPMELGGEASSAKNDPIGDGPIPMLPYPKDLPDPKEL